MAKCSICDGRSGFTRIKIKDGVICFNCFTKCGLNGGDASVRINAKEYNKEMFTILISEDAIRGNHLSGLPITEGKPCNLKFRKEDILFSVENTEQTFDLAYTRILNLDIKTNVEVQRQMVSSVGGAIAGDALFGTLGAIVGGRAKEVVTKDIEYYFIITYQKEDKSEYISFALNQDDVYMTTVQMKKMESLIEKVKPLCSIQTGHTSL